MSTTTLEKTAVDTGSDLASLVVAFHYKYHAEWTDTPPDECPQTMCKVAAMCLTLDEAFFGTDV